MGTKMIKCSQCGNDILDEAMFCPQCGAALKQDHIGMDDLPAQAAPNEQPQIEPQSYAEPQPVPVSMGDYGAAEQTIITKEPKKRRRRIWIPFAVTAGVIVLALIGIMILRSGSSPEKVAKQFLTAMERKDTGTLLKISSCQDFELTEDKLAPMLALYESDTLFKSTLVSSLENDSYRIMKGKKPGRGDSVNIVMKDNFISKGYKIQIASASIDVYSNIEGVGISFEGGTYALEAGENQMNIYDILPGIYHITGTYTDEASGESITAQKEARISGYGNYASLEFDCTTLRIQLPDAYKLNTVSVDGKEKTAVTDESGGVYKVYPVFCEKDITVTVENQWGDILTDTFSVPQSYAGMTYDYYGNFKSVTLNLQWPANIIMQDILINDKSAGFNPASDYQGFYTIYDVVPGASVKLLANNAVGKNVDATFTVEQGDGYSFEYTWEYDDKLSEDTKKEILNTASQFYMDVFAAYENEDLDALHALTADETNIFAFTYYALLKSKTDDTVSYYSYKLGKVTADAGSINSVASQYSVTISGECKVAYHYVDAVTGEDISDDPLDVMVTVDLTVAYNFETEKWEVVESRFDDYTTPDDFEEPIKIN